MPKTKVPALKNIPNTVDRELRDTLESMKEAQEVRLGRRGDPLDRAITLRELIDSGLAKQLSNRPFDPNGLTDFIPNEDEVGDLTVPPAPTGLEASGAFTEIIVDWNPAQYSNHAFTEVWRSRDDEIGTAVLITTTASFIITDPVGYDQTYFYWVRFVSTGNVRGPFNQTNGTKANTVENIAAVMIQLSETLQQLPGYSIITGLITTEAATAAVAARVIRSSGAPTTREDGSALTVNDIWFDTDDGQIYTRNAANNAWVAGRDATLVSLFGSTSFTGSTLSGAMATAQGDIVTVTNAQSSTASSLTSLTTTVTNNNNTLTSAINTEASTRSSADTTNATNISNLTSTINNGSTGLAAAHSAISSEATTRASEDSALSTLITNLTSTVSGNTSAISTEATTRASADSANATAISNLTSTVGGNSSSITSLNTTTASHTGDLNAMFVLTASTESNGSKSVAGMVIGSNASNGSGAQSYVQFQADKFAIWNGTNAEVAPFIVSGGSVFIDSARIQDGAITNARIQDATIQGAKIADATIVTAKIADAQITTAKITDANITTAKIEDAAINNAKINDLDAGKINAGFINAARIDANTITADKINVTDLALDFSAATVSGSTIGSWQNNQMRLRLVAELGTATGVYHIFCRVFGGSGQVKTLSIVAGDGTFGGFGNELRNTTAYQDGSAPTIPTQDQGFAQYHSGQSQFWSAIDRFDSSNEMVQKDFMVRKISNTSRTLRLYILAQGNGSNRQLSNVQFGVYRFTEI